jgi:hypothetical protein
LKLGWLNTICTLRWHFRHFFPGMSFVKHELIFGNYELIFRYNELIFCNYGLIFRKNEFRYLFTPKNKFIKIISIWNEFVSCVIPSLWPFSTWVVPVFLLENCIITLRICCLLFKFVFWRLICDMQASSPKIPFQNSILFSCAHCFLV